MGFQKSVNLNPAPAVAGDFATDNPRAVVPGYDGGLVAGQGGVKIGKFAWIGNDGKTVQSFGTYPDQPAGIVSRSGQGLITEYLAEASMTIPAGFPVVVHRSGDFFVSVTGGTVTRGNAVYANYATGDIVAGATSTDFSGTGSLGATCTGSLGATCTASADTDTTRLVVTSVTGLISIGDTVSGPGITQGTKITGQVSGTTGGEGTYQLDKANSASSATVTAFGSVVKLSAVTGRISIGDSISKANFPTATVTGQIDGTPGGTGTYTISSAGTQYVASVTGVKFFGDVLNVTVATSGKLSAGMPVTSANMPANAVVNEQLEGSAGGLGTYRISVRATDYVASEAVTGTGGIVTTWKCSTSALSGELVVVSR